MTADVLASIDGALHDYQTSGDAMRWTADRVICDGGRPLRIGRRPADILRDLGLAFSSEEAAASLATLGRQFQVLGQAMTDAYAPMIKSALEAAHAFDLALRPALHRRQCARCRPAACAKPLCINGHEYRRRQRNRRKRRR